MFRPSTNAFRSADWLAGPSMRLTTSHCLLHARGVKMAFSPEVPEKPDSISKTAKTGTLPDDRPINSNTVKLTPPEPEAKGIINTMTSRMSGILHSSIVVPDPTFNVIANGLGSVLHISLPKKSYVYSRRECALGRSGSISQRLSPEGGLATSLMRKLAGGNFFVESMATKDDEGDVLIAAHDIGDIAVLELEPGTYYHISRGAFLACGPHISVRAKTTDPLVQLHEKGILSLKASGSGPLAITAYGGLFRLVLEEGDTYYASTKHLVAWDSSMEPEPLNKDEENTNYFVGVIKNLFGLLKTKVTRNQEFCRLSGPGDFYLSSRVKPQLSYFKQSTHNTVQEYLTNNSNEKVVAAVASHEQRSKAATFKRPAILPDNVKTPADKAAAVESEKQRSVEKLKANDATDAAATAVAAVDPISSDYSAKRKLPSIAIPHSTRSSIWEKLKKMVSNK